MIEPRAEIAYVEPAAAGFTFSRMIGVAQRRAAGHLADDCPARDWRITFAVTAIRIVVALAVAVASRALATRPYSQSGAIDPQRTSPQKSRFSAGHDSVENAGYLSLHVNERIFFGA